MYFRGRSIRSLDAKGRLILPPEFREMLLSRSSDGQMMLTTYDNCIKGFPLPDWQTLEAQLIAIKKAPLQVRNFKRLVLGGAEQTACDASGRIRLSRDHLAYAGIGGEAVLMGYGTHFEIWQPARLDVAISGSFDDVAEHFGEDFEFDL